MRVIMRYFKRKFKAILTSFVNSFSKINIPLTINNYKILRLKNKYMGKRCFIIGNGPSLKPQDLEKLKNEFTFASNKIYKIFNRTNWRPTFYMVVDPVVMGENLTDINLVEAGKKFTLKGYKNMFTTADIFFNNNLYKDKRGTFSTNIMETLYSSGTVSFSMLQIAFYMGFSEVYLIGHDYNFKGAVSKTKDLSSLKNDTNTQIYFTKDYVRSDEKKAGQAPAEMYSGMEKAKLAYEGSGRKIYNATRVTYLDVFDIKNFDDILGDTNDKLHQNIN
ncbi:6-hydroxymethylpterin diphosphokinase MptE-like protein [Bacillus pinisoli]|uniref:6-hydroxymethylpterin diphosphokinase MptE-like protein n=1 Tax=Bacillus pinisoli TaxID=2901866 RepID=UPI001FF1DD49|nr:6-hydroxymethylpterin diphosphokinase MptE-like protein [Bacillus pinisoli]